MHESVGPQQRVGLVGHAGELDVGAPLLVLHGQVDIGIRHTVCSRDVPRTALALKLRDNNHNTTIQGNEREERQLEVSIRRLTETCC